MHLCIGHTWHLPLKRLRLVLLVGVLSMLCSCHRLSMRKPVRENEYVGATEQQVLSTKGAPQHVDKGYSAIPPQHPVNPNVVKTCYYRTGQGHLYLYYNQAGMVVESLYFDDGVLF